MILVNKTSHNASPRTSCINNTSTNPIANVAIDADYFYIDEGAGETIMAVMPPAKPEKQPTPPSGLPAYLVHLWTIPILNQAQEQHCFRKLNYLRYLQSRSPTPSNVCVECQKMQDDAEALQESIVHTRNHLVESNLRLVVSIAKRYCSPSLESFDELVCVGNAALIRAVDLFDFRRGVRFSTYAYQAVERSIFDSFRRDNRYRTRIAAAGDDVLDLFPGDAGESDRSVVEANEALDQVTELIAQLDDRDQYIVKARFGINRKGAGVAFQVIAKEIKLSTTRTVQLFNRSLEQMRSLLSKRSNT